jgi:hypothetical protein
MIFLSKDDDNEISFHLENISTISFAIFKPASAPKKS